MSTYIVRPGDTYSTIAARNGVSVSEIRAANPKTNPKNLQIGQLLSMPKKTPRKQPEENKTCATIPDNNDSNSYTIKPGDTLSGIAQKNGFSLTELRKANPKLDERRLIPGKTINLPSPPEQKNGFQDIDIKRALQEAIDASCADNNDDFFDILKDKPVVSGTSAPGNNMQPFGLNVKPTAQSGIPSTKKAEIIKTNVLKIAVEHAKNKEDFKSSVYKCASGKLTIGYGHRVLKGEKFNNISRKEAEKLCHKDMEKAYDGIIKALGHSAENLNETQLAALTNLAFNSGLEGVINSKYFALIKEGKIEEAQANMDSVYGNKIVNGKVVKDKNGNPVKEIKNGLLIRRVEEMIMFGNGKLGKPAQNRILELINESFGANFKSLQEASASFTKELKMLEQKNARKKPPLTQAETRRLKKLRNINPLFNTIANPQQYMATIKNNDAIASR